MLKIILSKIDFIKKTIFKFLMTKQAILYIFFDKYINCIDNLIVQKQK